MNYEFGDIIDARNVSFSRGHFIIVVGETNLKSQGRFELMYFTITSRVYKPFGKIVNFFNECIKNKYKKFFKHFKKEKPGYKKNSKNHNITLIKPLSAAVFLDCEEYSGILSQDSMVMITSEPDKVDKEVVKNFKDKEKINNAGRLTPLDVCRLITVLKNSPSISGYNDRKIRESFNALVSSRKGGPGEIKC